MTELALRSGLTDEQQDCLQLMRTAANTQLAMLNDLLDYVTICTTKLELTSSEVSLRELIDDCAETVAPAAHIKGIELIVRVTPEVPEFVVVDSARMARILLNLAIHAIGATTDGQVVIEATAEPVADGTVNLLISVADTGKGHTSEQLRSLLDPFRNDREGAPIGTALGLAACSHIVSAMGGTLRVDSVPGAGTEFSIDIPLVLPIRRQTFRWADRQITDLKVLIVDGNATSRLQLFDTLTRRGSRPVVASSTKEAVKRYDAAVAESDPFDAVVVDSDQTDGSGFELTAVLSERPCFNVPIIVMIRSVDQRGQIQMARRSGACACIVKPVREGDLYCTLDSMVAGSRDLVGLAPVLDHNRRAEASMDSILLVEDNQILQVVTSRILQKHGFAVSVASNGEEALAMLRDQRFSLVLMDIMMPVMDGLCAARRIREMEDQGVRRIPIVALTAMAVEGDRERCLNAGMDFYVTKPVKPKELLDVIRCFTSTPVVSPPA